MKTILSLLTLLLVVAPLAFAHAPAVPQEFGVSFGVFYSSLDQYGEWIQLEPQYYVWRPVRTSPDWRPYYYGHWAWTPDGWYWVSDEPWAWAVYHYGRWYYDDYYGWVWTPGYNWAPAWVEWRYSGDVIGWAPLGPYAVFRIGFGIHYSRSWVTPHSYWCFVGMRYMGGPRLYRHIHDRQYNHRYLVSTRSVDGVRYENSRIINRGPDRGFIEQHGGSRIRESQIVDVRDRTEQRVVRKGERDEIRVYRPRADERTPGSGAERPGRVREAERRPSLDLRSTDLDQGTQERQGRRTGDVREAPRGETSVPRGKPVSPGRVTPREQPRVQPTPEVRTRKQEPTPRTTRPDVRREVQPRREQRMETPRQPVEQRMNQRERPTQARGAVRPQQERRSAQTVRKAEPQRADRSREQGARKTEDRRERQTH